MANVLIGELEKFLLIFFRVGSFFVSAPILSSTSLPMRVKIVLSVLIAYILLPVVNFSYFKPTMEIGIVFFLILKETAIGLIAGFILTLIIEGIRIAGEVMGVQMGFGIVNVMDPAAQQELSMVAVMAFVIGIMIFLAIDGHLYLIKMIGLSFDILPVNTMKVTDNLLKLITQDMNKMFRLGMILALPVICVLLLITSTIGILSRALPKIQVFLLSFPLRILVGILTFAIGMPLFLKMLLKFFKIGVTEMLKILKAM